MVSFAVFWNIAYICLYFLAFGYFCFDLAYPYDLCTVSQKQVKYLVWMPGLQARAHRLLNLFPSNVIIKCTANSLYPGNPGRLFVETRVRVPLGLAKEKIKLGIRRCDASPRKNRATRGRVRQVGGFPQEQLEM